jgi:hypothetical protein
MPKLMLYTIIVKINNTDFAKYRNVSDIKRFTDFIDNKFPNWRWFNVFDKNTKVQVSSYTKKNRPL